jgi:opacity protein-like surface antigen
MNRIELLSFSLLFVATPAFALSGKTADGCSYKVINGQYLTTCAPKASDKVIQVAAAQAPVTSYDSVPMRMNPEAPIPSVQVAAPQTMAVSLSTPAQSAMLESSIENRQEEHHHDFQDSVYVGALVGSTSIKEAGSSTGLGLTLGTDLDEYFGLELGYNYTKQGMNLGLDSRGTDLGDTYPSRDDANLQSHLISGTVQGYLTEMGRKLRPYLGLGLGWKSSSLTEKNLGYAGESSGGTLSQSAFGGIAGAGAKLRVGKRFQVGLSFNYFFPLARQESRLRSNPSPYNDGYGQTRLTKADDELTGSAQALWQGGLEYSF